jgi:hypothetical protein
VEDNITMDLNKYVSVCRGFKLFSIGTSSEFCEHSSEHFSFIKGEKFLDALAIISFSERTLLNEVRT